MVKRVWVLPLLMVGLLALPSLAQDSTSKTWSGLPGDAVSPYDATEQVNTYIIDMVPFTTSWKNRFGIAPLMKSSKTSTTYFNNQISAQTMSSYQRLGVEFPFDVYDLWKGKGFGINGNSALNKQGMPIDVSDMGSITNQFAAAMSEYGTTENLAFGNYVSTAVVNYVPSKPNRLYVSRIASVINGPTDLDNFAQFGVGAVDEAGNTYFRADDYSVDPGGPVGQNIFRVDARSRDATKLNYLLAGGANDAAATDWLVVSSGTTHNVPSCVPYSIPNRAMYIGSNFNNQYAYEVSPGTVSYTNAHLGGTSDQRGNVSFSPTKVFAGTVGTASMLGKDAAGLTRRIILWGVLGNGSVSGTLSIDLPSTITDNEDFYVFPAAPDQVGDFNYHLSQTPFRGGNGQVSIGTDKNGDVLVAVAVEAGATSMSNPFGAIAVARFDPANPGGTLQWTTATYIDYKLNGKSIRNGSAGLWVGRQAAMFEVYSTTNGPSLSSPMIDSWGNIWFLAAVVLQKSSGFFDYDLALMRAVYDPANFKFELEKVVELGQVFHGRNSYCNYMITYLEIADSDSISSGTCWSQNIMSQAWNGMNPYTLDADDPRTLGGIVFKAGIVYDVNNDWDFDYANPPDESYNALLYIGYPGDGEPEWPNVTPNSKALNQKNEARSGNVSSQL